ncbi:hypothetical protein F8M41_010503 [Gigaspora margarita]|uniref:Uncharacterized protein n=1 Tax=Gigaspora margarita TaxID=4874 RepID=A0A8H4A2F4_GIGMA|nr:hypothetical protein F8M41_010503 [Gigaspora margarita]
MISKSANSNKRAVLSSEPKTNRKIKKRTPSSFILYKNKYNLSPQVARQKYKQEPEEVRIAFDRQAEILRFKSTSKFINLDSSCFTFFNDRVDNTSVPVSAVNDPETKLCPHLNNVTNSPTSLEQSFFQTSHGNLMTQNVTSFHLDHDFQEKVVSRTYLDM